MSVISKLPRRARWAVPAGAVAAVGLVIAGSALAGAQSAPQLPARTTAQLLAAVDSTSALPSALQAVVQETANLGLPSLPGSSTADPLSGLSLLSGTHTFRIWYDGPTRIRIAIPVPMGEADFRRDGRDVWVWDSRTNQATHLVLPAGTDAAPALQATLPSAPTPQQVARQILAAVGTTTTVGLRPSITVAGQAAYQLSLAPKDSRSLIGQVRIAIDAEYSLPLQVQVFARGSSSPAFSVGYTSLSFSRPDGSNFPFTPPPGARVKTITAPAAEGFPSSAPVPLPAGAAGVPPQEVIKNLGNNGGGFINVRAGFDCAHPPRLPAAMLKQIAAQLPSDMPRAQRAALLRGLTAGPGCRAGRALPARVWAAILPASEAVPPGFMPGGGPTVLGQGWLSVLVLPSTGVPDTGAAACMPEVSNSLGSSSSTSPPSGTAGVCTWTSDTFSSSSSGTVTITSGAMSGGPGIDVSGLGAALMHAARPVHGSWGSGRLITTSLISVLITDGGQVLIGAVQPSVLYADAAQLR